MKWNARSAFRSALYFCAVWVLLESVFLIASGLGWMPGLRSALTVSPFSEVGWGLRLCCFFAGLILFLISAAALLTPLVPPNENPIQLDNEKGRVWLSDRTLSEYLQKKSEGIEDIEGLRIRTITGQEKISLEVEVSVKGEAPLPEITENIQSLVERELREMIGVAQIDAIHIHFKKIGVMPSELPPADRQLEHSAGEEDVETIEAETVEDEKASSAPHKGEK